MESRSVFGERNLNNTNSHKPSAEKVEVSVPSHLQYLIIFNQFRISFTRQLVFQGQLLKLKREEAVPRKIVSTKRRFVPVRAPLNGQKQKDTPVTLTLSAQKPKPPAVCQTLTCSCYMTDRICNICLSRYTLCISSKSHISGIFQCAQCSSFFSFF